MAQARAGDTVKVIYEGRLTNGTIFDSSEEDSPLKFTLGSGELIAGFDEAVAGMSVGETKTIEIPANRAYGARNEKLVQEVDRSQLPSHIKLERGRQLSIPADDGSTLVATIIDLSDTIVTLDANHILAGKDLVFDITLLEIVS